MTREQLENMKVTELRAMCKENNIPYSVHDHKFTKSELVGILFADLNNEPTKEEAPEELVDDQELYYKQEKHSEYIESVQVGMLVAFKDDTLNKGINTAKVLRKSSKNHRLKVETQYGKEYIISYDDVLWVRTNNRWPKWIYNMLKGVGEANEAKK